MKSILLGLALVNVVFLLGVVLRQGATIKQQQALINAMAQSPACMGVIPRVNHRLPLNPGHVVSELPNPTQKVI